MEPFYNPCLCAENSNKGFALQHKDSADARESREFLDESLVVYAQKSTMKAQI